MKSVFFCLELPEAAHALLTAAALSEGHASLEDSARDHLLRDHFPVECRAFANAVADPADGTLNAIFNLTEKINSFMKAQHQHSNETTTHNEKSRQLTRLRERAQAALQAARDAGEGYLSNAGPHRKKWHKILRQIDRLEESFVSHQGYDVDAEAIAYQSGSITINERLYFDGEERLHRAPDGTYYLFREDEQHGEHVHRLSLAAAILWAVARANMTGRGLRDDVNRLLRAISPKEESRAQEGSRGAHTITLNLSPAAHAMLTIMAEHDGYPTIKDALLGSAAGNISSLFNQVYDEPAAVEEILGCRSDKGDKKEVQRA